MFLRSRAYLKASRSADPLSKFKKIWASLNWLPAECQSGSSCTLKDRPVSSRLVIRDLQRQPIKIAIVIGTRPEIIKMAPIVHECVRLKLNFILIHSGQHYSRNMSEGFLRGLDYPPVDYHLKVGSGSHAEETGRGLIRIEQVLRLERPNVVLVQGDTNTVLSGALAAAKLGVPVGHVEAGLRSFDETMPEEINRKVADHVSTFLFAPTETARLNLLHEGMKASRIFVTGNTIVDAVDQQLHRRVKIRETRTQRKKDQPRGYFLVTIHRQENVDDDQRFREIMKGLGLLRRQFGRDIIYPMHPRARKQMQKLGLRLGRIVIANPLNYNEFIDLERNATLIITDSGGVQEEACILRVPCVTIRNSTERPETVEVGSNILADSNSDDIIAKATNMLSRRRSWSNPFGDGKAAVRILDVLRHNYLESSGNPAEDPFLQDGFVRPSFDGKPEAAHQGLRVEPL